MRSEEDRDELEVLTDMVLEELEIPENLREEAKRRVERAAVDGSVNGPLTLDQIRKLAEKARDSLLN